MTNPAFKFSSPRLEVCLAHLSLLKQARRVLEEELPKELVRLRKHLEEHLMELAPSLKDRWTVGLKEDQVAIRPVARSKKLSRGCKIAVRLSRTDSPLEDESYPWVGVWIEGLAADQSQRIYDELMLTSHKKLDEEWDRPEKEYPLWAYVRYERSVLPEHNGNGSGAFSTDHFVAAVVRLVDKIASNWDDVESAAARVLDVQE